MNLETILIVLVVGLGLTCVYLWKKSTEGKSVEGIEEKVTKAAAEALKTNSEQFLAVAKEILNSEKKEIRTDLEGKKSIIGEIVKEIRDDIKKNEIRNSQSDEDRVKSFTSLKQELQDYKLITGELRMSTEKLKNLLSNNQMRGAFGEQIAEDLLKMAGFVIGQDYFCNELQSSQTRPDFTILLPDKTKVNIDAKFPYSSLVKTIEAENEEERARYFASFKQDVKEKIKQVCTRDYINPDEKTVDFVILFVPNEMIFSYIYEKMNDVWEDAMRKKVILAGPFSFTAILRMIRQAYTNFRYQENLHHIIGLIQKFDEEYEAYSKSVDMLGERINSAHKQFDQVSTTRDRKLTTIVDKIKTNKVIENVDSEEIKLPIMGETVK